jgi:hypothetical protein
MALPPTKYNESLPGGSKVISGGHTDRHTHTQTGDLLRVLSFLESRLKRTLPQALIRFGAQIQWFFSGIFD